MFFEITKINKKSISEGKKVSGEKKNKTTEKSLLSEIKSGFQFRPGELKK